MLDIGRRIGSGRIEEEMLDDKNGRVTRRQIAVVCWVLAGLCLSADAVDAEDAEEWEPRGRGVDGASGSASGSPPPPPVSLCSHIADTSFFRPFPSPFRHARETTSSLPPTEHTCSAEEYVRVRTRALIRMRIITFSFLSQLPVRVLLMVKSPSPIPRSHYLQQVATKASVYSHKQTQAGVMLATNTGYDN